MGKQVVFTVMAGWVLERQKRRMGTVFQALARSFQHVLDKREKTNMNKQTSEEESKTKKYVAYLRWRNIC